MQIVKNRRLARELVLQALYAYEFTKDAPAKILQDLKRYNIVEKEMENYIFELFTKAIKYQDWSKKEVISRLKNWDYKRVALIDRLILQMMIVEMVYMDEIPPKVSITEGVEIAKKYSTEDSGAFINGILDSVYHALEELHQSIK